MKIIIIGSSTGGPFILEQVFHDFPKVHAAVIIVQHLPPAFNSSFRNHISVLTQMNVLTAEHGMHISEGSIYLAPSGTHLFLEKNRFVILKDGLKVHGVKPAVDCTMSSLIQTKDDRFMGVILTGMGQDGTEGIVHMDSLGATIIVQDPSTAPIASMPQSAIDTGKVRYILPPDRIKESIIQFSL